MTTLTNARKKIFQLADKALNGARVEFTYKGVVFVLAPELPKKTKLENLISEPTLAAGCDILHAEAELTEEIAAAGDKKWDSL